MSKWTHEWTDKWIVYDYNIHSSLYFMYMCPNVFFAPLQVVRAWEWEREKENGQSEGESESVKKRKREGGKERARARARAREQDNPSIQTLFHVWVSQRRFRSTASDLGVEMIMMSIHLFNRWWRRPKDAKKSAFDRISPYPAYAHISSALYSVAVCCSVLKCVEACYDVFQCVAVCCSALQCVTVCCSLSKCTAVYCSVLQCVVVCCSVLQCVVVCCSV